MLGLQSAIGLLAAGAGTLWGAVDSKRKVDKAIANEGERHAQANNYYNREINADYMNRSDIQALLTKSRDLLNEQYRNARATNIVSGGSDASLAMQKAAANQSLAQTMQSIASTNASRVDALKQAQQAENDAHFNAMTGIYDSQAQRSAQAGAELAKVGGEFIDADDGSWRLFRRNKNGKVEVG